MEYSEVQQIAKKTIEYAKTIIKPGMNLLDLRDLCERKMLELGADSFWYWDIGAFVFAGDETTVSVSGKKYVTSDRTIAENDIVTIDLSPQCENIWGDYARTIILENGVVVDKREISNEEWRKGLQMEDRLHHELTEFVNTETTFEELYYHINEIILKAGFVNLDFMGNLGHSIVKNKNDRVYTEKGNTQRISEVKYFTFEPHISIPGSKYGYKKENIYYFQNGKPVDMLAFQPDVANIDDPVMPYIYLNNTMLLAKYFQKRPNMMKQPGAYFHIGYPPAYFLYNIMELAFPRFTGFYTVHGPSPLKKSTYETLWNLEPELLTSVCSHAFRHKEDVSQYVLREYQKLQGDFVPQNVQKLCGYFNLENQNLKLTKTIEKHKIPMVCVNDSNYAIDFEKVQKEINGALEQRLSRKSLFEM